MDYAYYREMGLTISSGAIESANRTLVQERCKLSGQRWTATGIQQVLNLRALNMSNQWSKVENLIMHNCLQKSA